jgi:hypothetical protein
MGHKDGGPVITALQEGDSGDGAIDQGSSRSVRFLSSWKKGRPTSGRPPLWPYFCGFGGSGFGCGFGCGFGGSGFGCSVANVDVLIAISPFALLRISMR